MLRDQPPATASALATCHLLGKGNAVSTGSVCGLPRGTATLGGWEVLSRGPGTELSFKRPWCRKGFLSLDSGYGRFHLVAALRERTRFLPRLGSTSSHGQCPAWLWEPCWLRRAPRLPRVALVVRLRVPLGTHPGDLQTALEARGGEAGQLTRGPDCLFFLSKGHESAKQMEKITRVLFFGVFKKQTKILSHGYCLVAHTWRAVRRGESWSGCVW